MPEHNPIPPEQQIEILKLVYTEEGQNLRFETETAQRLMTYFVTLELALGAWIASAGSLDEHARWAIFGLNAVFGLCVAILVRLNYRRRDEVVTPLRRALRALRLAEEGAYLSGEPIHAWEVNVSWQPGYRVLIALFCAAQALPLYYFSAGAP